jgi:hypothetical protein
VTDPLIDAVAHVAGTAPRTGAASASALLTGVFGPAADDVGAALARRTARQLGNVAAVAVAAFEKSGRSPDGQTSRRAAMRIAEESAAAENDVVTEYLSGILASAKSPDGSDDRAVGWSALVSRLSSDQLLLHFLLYWALRQHLLGRQEDSPDAVCEESCFVSYVTLYESMGWVDGEGPRFQDALYGLHHEGLVGTTWTYGPAEGLESRYELAFPDGGVVFQASRPGLGLWAWGMGYGARRITDVLDPELEIQPAVLHVSLKLPQTKLLSELPPTAPSS